MVQKVRFQKGEVDFSELRIEVDTKGYTAAEVTEALTQMGMMVFHTLFEIAGEALTEPLLRHLEEQLRAVETKRASS